MEILHAIRHENKNNESLLVLHGLFGQADNWNTLGKKWSEHYDVHLLDLRNHGRSFHSDAMDFAHMAQDILDYMDAHAIQKAHVLGHSLGGKAVMEFAHRHANRLSKLVVVDIAPKAYPPHHNEIIAALKAVPIQGIQKRSEAEVALKPLISDIPTRQFLLKNVHRLDSGQYAWRFNLPVIAANYTQLIGENQATEPFLGSTLFVAGGDSHYIEQEDEPLIATRFPKSRVERIAKANHWVHATQPQIFSQVVLTFLQE